MLPSSVAVLSITGWSGEDLSSPLVSAESSQSLLDVVQLALQRLDDRRRVAAGTAVWSQHDLRQRVFMNADLVLDR